MWNYIMNKKRFFNPFLLSIFLSCFSIFTSQLSHGASILIRWDSNTEEWHSGYKLYYRTSSSHYGEPLDLGNVTTYQLSSLIEDETYYIALTAYDTLGIESEKTEKVITISQLTEEEETSCNNPHKLIPVSVITSSESFFWSKDNAIDGDPRTFWSSAVTFFWTNEFITLDLGETKQISSIGMLGTELFGIDYFPTNFQIQVSKDNLNWEEVMNENDYRIQSSDTNNSWHLNTPEARYVRIYITKAKTFFLLHLVQIAEIEVYGCDMSEPLTKRFAERLLINDEKQEDNTQAESLNIPVPEQLVPTTPGRPEITFK